MSQDMTELLLKQIAESVKVLREQVDKLDTSIRGNGKPGLGQRVANLEREQQFWKEERAELKGKKSVWGRIVPGVVQTLASAAILGFVAWVFGLWEKTNCY